MRRAWVLGAAALAAGCVSLGPRPEPPRYYVLEPQAGGQEPAGPALDVLGVRPVRLPPYLDRRELVTRVRPAQVGVAGGDRWAAPLDVLFGNVLAEDLRAALPAREVLAEPWPAGGAPEWSVSVDVLRFEAEADGTAVLEARWTVLRRGAPAGRGITRAREGSTAGDTAAGVAALSRTVWVLAREVAAGVAAARGVAEAAPR